MTVELNHKGMNVEIDEKVIEDAAQIGIDVVAEIKAAIDEDVATHPTEIYTKPNCPYCVRAKAILEKRGIPFVELSAVDLREQLIERVTASTGMAPRTVPQIYLEGKYIGGHDQLVAYFAELDKE